MSNFIPILVTVPSYRCLQLTVFVFCTHTTSILRSTLGFQDLIPFHKTRYCCTTCKLARRYSPIRCRSYFCTECFQRLISSSVHLPERSITSGQCWDDAVTHATQNQSAAIAFRFLPPCVCTSPSACCLRLLSIDPNVNRLVNAVNAMLPSV
jgi:hypothetical protein